MGFRQARAELHRDSSGKKTIPVFAGVELFCAATMGVRRKSFQRFYGTSGEGYGNRTSLTMSALSNLFLSALLPSLPRVVLFVFFDLGIDDHGSFVI